MAVFRNTFIIAYVLILAAAAVPAEESPQGAVEWDTFRSRGMGISVDYPLRASFTEPRINTIRIAYPLQSLPDVADSGDLIYVIRSCERPRGQSLQEFARHRYREDIQGGRLVENISHTTVGGKKAYRYVMENGGVEVHVAFSNGAEGALLVRFTKPEAGQARLWTIIERMNRSLTPLGELGPEPGSEGEPTRFSVHLAEGYTNRVQANPEAFSWEELARNVRIRIQPSGHWNRTGGDRKVRLEATAVRSNAVVGRTAGEAFPVVADGTPLNVQGLPVEHTGVGGRVPGKPRRFGSGLRRLARRLSLGFEEGDRFYAPFPAAAVNPRRDDELARAALGRKALVLYLDYADPASSWAAVTVPLVFLLPEPRAPSF